VRGVRAEDILALLVSTFGGFTASRESPHWIRQTEGDISDLVRRLLAAHLAERDGDLIHLTLLGRVCGSPRSFSSAVGRPSTAILPGCGRPT
jgi:helicase